jgi:cellulose synthase/poly-beta-1,6-N-acetylglucosamine synthase-like glycosyltransferase
MSSLPEQGGTSPQVAVVVASAGEPAMLGACLDALREQSAAWQAEVVVARAGSGADVEVLARRWPFARFIACPAGTSAAQLRAAGMRESNGDIVALVDDGYVPAGDWLGRLVSGYRAQAAHA